MADILFKEKSYKIIGACFEVHKILGHGFKEAVYKDALELELIKLEIPFTREKPLQSSLEPPRVESAMPGLNLLFHTCANTSRAVRPLSSSTWTAAAAGRWAITWPATPGRTGSRSAHSAAA